MAKGKMLKKNVNDGQSEKHLSRWPVSGRVASEQKSLQHFLVINFMKMFPISEELKKWMK